MFDNIKLDYDVKYFNEMSKEEIEKFINSKEADAVIELKQNNGTISFDYIVEEKKWIC